LRIRTSQETVLHVGQETVQHVGQEPVQHAGIKDCIYTIDGGCKIPVKVSHQSVVAFQQRCPGGGESQGAFPMVIWEPGLRQGVFLKQSLGKLIAHFDQKGIAADN
jgi:hypothetical protein